MKPVLEAATVGSKSQGVYNWRLRPSRAPDLVTSLPPVSLWLRRHCSGSDETTWEIDFIFLEDHARLVKECIDRSETEDLVVWEDWGENVNREQW